MGSTPGSMPGSRSRAVGRWLRDENDISDLLNYLHVLDRAPLAALLNTPRGELELVRERTFSLSREDIDADLLSNLDERAKKQQRSYGGRFDLYAQVDDRPWAVIEVKLGAEAHGWQFQLYDAWCDVDSDTLPSVPLERRFIFAIDDGPLGSRAGWTRIALKDVLSGWLDSPSPAAAALAADSTEYLARLLQDSHGRADIVGSSKLADRFRIRLLYQDLERHLVGTPLTPGSTKSGIGQANLSVSDEGRNLHLEVERSDRAKRDAVFKLNFFVDAPTVEEALTRAKHLEDEIKPSSVRIALGDAGDAIDWKMTGSGFRNLQSSDRKRFYGYTPEDSRWSMLGTRLLFRTDVTLPQMSTTIIAASKYLLSVGAKGEPADAGFVDEQSKCAPE